jgi:hypothetical protein
MKENDEEKHPIPSPHEDVTVGEVDEAKDSVDHGVADGDEGIEASQGDAVQDLLNVSGHLAS